jgi:hypothetical protein
VALRDYNPWSGSSCRNLAAIGASSMHYGCFVSLKRLVYLVNTQHRENMSQLWSISYRGERKRG